MFSRQPRAALAGWQTVFFDGFEGSWPNGFWNAPSGDPAWGTTGHMSYSGGTSLWCAAGGSSRRNPAYDDYANDMLTWAVCGPFDLSDATDAALAFRLWYETEREYDEFYLQVSRDSLSWVGWPGTSGSSGGWFDAQVDLADVPDLGNLCGDDSVWIGFGFSSDGSVTAPGVYVDDILLQKNVETQPPAGCLCESHHPYGDYEWGNMCTLTNPDASAGCTRVHFGRIELGQGAVIRLKTGGGETQEEIRGPKTLADHWSQCISGSTVIVELETGSYPSAWGFCIDQVGEGPTPTCPGEPLLNAIANADCDDEYTVTWSAPHGTSPGTTTYILEEDASDDFGSPTEVFRGTEQQAHIADRDPATYHYRVKASNPSCESGWSNLRSVIVPQDPLEVPILDSIINDDCDCEFDLNWSDVVGAESYRIESAGNGGFVGPTSFVTVESSAHIADSCTGTFYYRVYARNCRTESEASNVQSVTALRPPALHTIDNADCDGDYVVSWSPVNSTSGYELQQAHQGQSDWSTVYCGAASSHGVTGQSPGSYQYRVRVRGLVCDSSWSAPSAVKVWPIPKSPYLWPIHNDDRDGEFDVGWSSVDDTEHYELQQAGNGSFENASIEYSGAGTSGHYENHIPGTWWFRVRACNCRGSGEWSNARSATVAEPPSLASITAAIDGVPNDVIGCFVSLPDQGVPVWNTFTAHILAGEGDVSRVEFTLNGQTRTDTSSAGGWQATFDMSELPAGNAWIRAVAFSGSGTPSEPLSALIWTVGPPPWYGASWVLSPTVSWAPAEGKYHFAGRVPGTPPLYHQFTVDLLYFGSLRNTFASDIAVWESFRIDGLWTYQANGELLAELLGVPLVSRQYASQPLVQQATHPAWHSGAGYQWSSNWDYQGAKIPVVPRIGFVLPPPMPPLEVAASVDIGFDGSATIAGRLHSDLRPDQIRITPAANAYAQIDVGLEALGGVIGQGLGVRPEIGVGMPVVYDLTPPPGQSTIYLDQPCVSFALKGNVYTKVLFHKIHYGTVTLYSDSWPGVCQGAGSRQTLTSDFEPPVDLFLSPSVAADGQGHALAVWVADKDDAADIVDPEVQFACWGSGLWSVAADLTDNDRFETDPSVAYLDDGKALAVWTQNEITRGQSGSVEDLDQAMNAQEIYASVWDGSWAAPARLTHDDRPDGRAALATGPDGLAMTLWVHDSDGNSATRGDLSIHYANWLGDHWSTPAVLAAESAAETSPSMAIASNGFGMATWVHDADANPYTVSDRYLAYGYWSDGAWDRMRVRTDWPAGVLYPQPAFAPDGQLLVVFTAREQDDEGQYYGEGTRDLLWIARWFADAWHVEPIGDRIVAHEPHLQINADNLAMVTYRGFQGAGTEGYGGDVMMTVADLSAADLVWSEPQYQTRDAARDWQVSAAWEPLSGTTLILDQHTDLSGHNVGLSVVRGSARASALQAELYALRVPLGVDLSVATSDITFSNAHPDAGEQVVITATVHNVGLEPIRQPFDLFLKAGADVLIDGSFELPLAANSSHDLVVTWTAPGGTQYVFVALDEGDALDELDEQNNSATALLGAMPAPPFPVASPAAQGGAIVLAWPALETAALSEYRVHRGDQPGGPYTQIADTSDTGYVDEDVVVGAPYYYVLTAVDEFGVESDSSVEVTAVALPPLAPSAYLPFVINADITVGPGPFFAEMQLGQQR